MDREFSRGAVAILDVLGWKGIWSKVRSWELLEELKLAVPVITESFAEMTLPSIGMPVSWTKILFLSDTVVIAATASATQDEENRRAEDLVTLLKVCTAASEVMNYMLRLKSKPLAYRGAIAVGDFIIEEQFILGAAVDEAAEAEKLAEGAFVLFCPSATAVFEAVGQKRAEMIAALRIEEAYPVPLKGGGIFETMVLCPAGSARELIPKLPLAFDSPHIDVAVKRQNTERFLRHVAETQEQAAAPVGGGHLRDLVEEALQAGATSTPVAGYIPPKDDEAE